LPLIIAYRIRPLITVAKTFSATPEANCDI
jgi:hypothetical protein